jgi:hypothetical protein
VLFMLYNNNTKKGIGLWLGLCSGSDEEKISNKYDDFTAWRSDQITGERERERESQGSSDGERRRRRIVGCVELRDELDGGAGLLSRIFRLLRHLRRGRSRFDFPWHASPPPRPRRSSAVPSHSSAITELNSNEIPSFFLSISFSIQLLSFCSFLPGQA